MSVTSPQPDEGQEPSFYHGTSFAVNEIILGMNVLTRKVRDLKSGNEAGSAVQQKLSSEEVSKIAGQIKMMADTITRVTVGHLNRRPRT